MSPRIERTPPYMQVVEHFRKQIVDGVLKDGDRIPAVRQIAEDWNLAHATAAKVLATLRGDGLVESRPGVGTIVRGRVHRSAADRALRMLTTGKIYAPGEYAVIKSAGLAPAPANIAEALGIEEGAQAVQRVRVTHDETGPISASTSWFSGDMAEVAPALLTTERIPGGTPSVIEEATGRRTHVVEERKTVGIADAAQAQALGVEVGSPILVGLNTYRDADGEPIEVGESVAGPGRWFYNRYEVTGD
ncbi:GntR family transcriptional regulator (plasmid) [Streptomyces sp. NBC_01426]|uniref:GntR family transcriptional regulator n=1 Tax=Streptomyces sp. NBC_01426 TaxID=2975866 RepID=UPI002E347961|nr:GntR family transcriptional regulator [Streptomyces sp. NBC_01426]